MSISTDVRKVADDLEATIGGCGQCIAEDDDGKCEASDCFECLDAVCKTAAERLRGIVGSEDDESASLAEVPSESVSFEAGASGTAVSFLADEERSALEWVREMGGVDAVKARMMPEGCEWPRFEDGEPMKFGDVFADRSGKPHVLHQVNLRDDEASGLGSNVVLKGSTSRKYDGVACNVWDGERVKRPAVLAADGEPLEVGQTVYATHYGYVKCTVLAIEWVVDGYLVEVENEGGHKFRQTPDEFIHQRTVLDADGEPLEVGQTVWNVNNGMEFTVSRLPKPGEYQAVEVRYRNGSSTSFDPDQLTHQRPEPPDSWDRIEEDATRMPGEYCERYEIYGDSFPQAEAMACDIVRRCRALAERGV